MYDILSLTNSTLLTAEMILFVYFVLNVHSPKDDKIGDMKDSFYEDVYLINSLNIIWKFC
jgi:hypothetical protein